MNEQIKTLDFKINEKTTINDLIILCIDSFNEIFKEEKVLYRLDTKYNEYNFKPSKKTGKPNHDLPSKPLIT